ncbi:MAG TPA: hypothetical protein VED46_11945 [Alphaproteobacteria bacterium]|nr:hypothetical protein [Alphaproteobacteria bacterium]
MVEGLSELVAACGVRRPISPVERIAEGETHWFIGYAAAAPEEMVALSQTETLKLVFRQEDVREVARHGERFLVRVRDGANMLVSFEQVIKAAPTCGCEDGRREGSGQQARAKDIDVHLINISNCVIRIDCFTVTVPLLGSTRVCIPTGFTCTRETNGSPS